MLREKISSGHRWSLTKLAPFSSRVRQQLDQIERTEFLRHVSKRGLDELENRLKSVSLDQVRSFCQNDPWGTNYLVNVWEYVHGVAELSSYP